MCSLYMRAIPHPLEGFGGMLAQEKIELLESKKYSD